MNELKLSEFIHASGEVDSIDSLVKLFLRFVGKFGYEGLIMSSMAHDKRQDREDHHGLVRNFPADWMARYFEKHYIDHDGVYTKALETRAPFTWQSVRDDPNVTKECLQILDEAREHGLHDGIALSIDKPHGVLIGMGLAGTEKGIDTSNDALWQIYSAAGMFQLIFDKLGGFNALEGHITLTVREREILQLFATDHDVHGVADKLNISEHTVNYHQRRIYKKLSTNNILGAVLRAHHLGILYP